MKQGQLTYDDSHPILVRNYWSNIIGRLEWESKTKSYIFYPIQDNDIIQITMDELKTLYKHMQVITMRRRHDNRHGWN